MTHCETVYISICDFLYSSSSSSAITPDTELIVLTETITATITTKSIKTVRKTPISCSFQLCPAIYTNFYTSGCPKMQRSHNVWSRYPLHLCHIMYNSLFPTAPFPLLPVYLKKLIFQLKLHPVQLFLRNTAFLTSILLNPDHFIERRYQGSICCLQSFNIHNSAL